MSRVGSKKRAKNDDPYEKLVAEYRRAPGTGWPATATAIAKWALDNNRAVYSRLTQQQMLAKSIARSMGEEIFTDPKGSQEALLSEDGRNTERDETAIIPVVRHRDCSARRVSLRCSVSATSDGGQCKATQDGCR